MAEKRKITREKKRLKVLFGPNERHRVGFTDDISSGGFFIKTSFVFAPGSSLLIELTPAEGGRILLEGKVQWAKKVPPNLVRLAKKCGMGIRIQRFVEGEELFNSLFRD